MFEEFYLSQTLLRRRPALIRPAKIFAFLGNHFVPGLHLFDHLSLLNAFSNKRKGSQSVKSLTNRVKTFRFHTPFLEQALGERFTVSPTGNYSPNASSEDPLREKQRRGIRSVRNERH
jgi:hypothetical protein